MLAQGIKLAITCFDEAIISTIHGFCNRVLAENSFETRSLFEAELDKASKEMALEGVQEYWRERFSCVPSVVSACASTKGVKPDEMADFFNGLPSTQEYVLGFEQEVDIREAVDSLLAGFENLRASWPNGHADYADYAFQLPVQERPCEDQPRKAFAYSRSSSFEGRAFAFRHRDLG